MGKTPDPAHEKLFQQALNNTKSGYSSHGQKNQVCQFPKKQL
ncbi:hypothetical protein VL20_6503 [Microcystis panniformis FACHB-1757]|uniref:Uncharacterized protein n=1 Tax=Microcystis panniformis FACHB-1757 TaxID=1638788 RepID=A0A0K1SB02_9CHRO|nr:hypothetical protein VL20_6503 [Microcystis panniformis FACHB-1757]